MGENPKEEKNVLEVRGDDHIQGPEDAEVTLIQYGDFECASCRDLYPVIKRIQNRIGTRLQLVFRHYPLTDQHTHAMKAAEAAEAAAAQNGDMFWKMHDQMYEGPEDLTYEVLEDLAGEVGLDVEKFTNELDNDTYKAKVEQHLQSGSENGVTGTPTFFINGERYDGALEFEPLLAAIAEAGDFTDILRSLDQGNRKLRETIDRSERGAPAAGRAVRDRFSADEIFQRVTASADEEIDRSTSLLFFSGLAAGLIIGASFFARAVMTTAYPGDPVGLGNILYPIGFVAIVLGGYQLFTENTLTPVTLVLTRLASIPSLLRLWGIVLFANVAGAACGAMLFAWTGVLEADVAETAHHFGEHALSMTRSQLFSKATIAGGLVATMVWLVHAARDTISRFFIIYTIMFLIPAGDLFHCVVGAFEILYLVFAGSADFLSVFADFFVPVVIGNTVGGVLFVTFINYGMTSEREIQHYNFRSKLSITEWLFGERVYQLFNENKEEADNEG